MKTYLIERGHQGGRLGRSVLKLNLNLITEHVAILWTGEKLAKQQQKMV